jgi:hypothetical protein
MPNLTITLSNLTVALYNPHHHSVQRHHHSVQPHHHSVHHSPSLCSTSPATSTLTAVVTTVPSKEAISYGGQHTALLARFFASTDQHISRGATTTTQRTPFACECVCVCVVCVCVCVCVRACVCAHARAHGHRKELCGFASFVSTARCSLFVHLTMPPPPPPHPPTHKHAQTQVPEHAVCAHSISHFSREKCNRCLLPDRSTV